MEKKRSYIDMHTHMFNGYYVPIEEFLYYCILGRVLILRPIAVSLGAVLKLIIGLVGTYGTVESIIKYILKLDHKGLTVEEAAKLAAKFFSDLIFTELRKQVSLHESKEDKIESLNNSQLAHALVEFIDTDTEIMHSLEEIKQDAQLYYFEGLREEDSFKTILINSLIGEALDVRNGEKRVTDIIYKYLITPKVQ